MRIKQSILISLAIALLLMTVGTAVAVEAPVEEWNMTFDIGSLDVIYSVQQTSPDGGYILAGLTDFVGALLLKTDENGIEEWNKTFDNGYEDYAQSVQQTSDGGYILAGTTLLVNQGFDAWLIKTNETGVEEWNKTFGGTGADEAYSVQQTSDGGYILAGYTGVFGTGEKDAWLIKTNETGVEEWNKTFGGINDDRALSVQQTSDGGYILAGSKSTLGEDSDAWLIKTDKNGTLEWDMTFASATMSEEEARSVQQTSDGGYILAGYTGPADLNPDAWLIKTNETGVEEWNKTFGSTGYSNAWSVEQTSDGGYILAGFTTVDYVNSSGWLIKTDENGIEEWNITLNDSVASSVRQTLDGGYILAGVAGSFASGTDALLVKLAGTSQGATTHYVGGDGYTTIQEAVDAAADWDTIIVSSGTYTENVDVYKELIIVSESGADNTIVQAADSTKAAFYVTSDNVTISGFTTKGGHCGIWLEDSDNNNLKNNTAEQNNNGIYLSYSNYNQLTSNKVLDNAYNGINLWYSSNNIVMDNKVLDNYPSTGIHLSHSYSNNLTGNNVSNNGLGIRLGDITSNNIIYNNNFNNGDNNVLDTGDNIWNSTEKLNYTYEGRGWTNYIGNYYSNYGGLDGNGDGIGDTPYTDTSNIRDNYPLMSWPVELVDQLPINENELEDALEELAVNLTDFGVASKDIDKVTSTLVDKEDTEKAIDILENLIDNLEKLVNKGKLTPEEEQQAEDLIKEIEDVIKLIENSEG